MYLLHFLSCTLSLDKSALDALLIILGVSGSECGTKVKIAFNQCQGHIKQVQQVLEGSRNLQGRDGMETEEWMRTDDVDCHDFCYRTIVRRHTAHGSCLPA